MVKVGTKRQENCLLTIEHHVAEDWNAQSDVNYILNTQVRVQRNAKTTIIIFGLYKSGCTIFGHKDVQYYCRKSVEQLESMVSLFMHVCAQHTTSEHCLSPGGYLVAEESHTQINVNCILYILGWIYVTDD